MINFSSMSPEKQLIDFLKNVTDKKISLEVKSKFLSEANKDLIEKIQSVAAACLKDLENFSDDKSIEIKKGILAIQQFAKFSGEINDLSFAYQTTIQQFLLSPNATFSSACDWIEKALLREQSLNKAKEIEVNQQNLSSSTPENFCNQLKNLMPGKNSPESLLKKIEDDCLFAQNFHYCAEKLLKIFEELQPALDSPKTPLQFGIANRFCHIDLTNICAFTKKILSEKNSAPDRLNSSLPNYLSLRGEGSIENCLSQMQTICFDNRSSCDYISDILGWKYTDELNDSGKIYTLLKDDKFFFDTCLKHFKSLGLDVLEKIPADLREVLEKLKSIEGFLQEYELARSDAVEICIGDVKSVDLQQLFVKTELLKINPDRKETYIGTNFTCYKSEVLSQEDLFVVNKRQQDEKAEDKICELLKNQTIFNQCYKYFQQLQERPAELAEIRKNEKIKNALESMDNLALGSKMSAEYFSEFIEDMIQDKESMYKLFLKSGILKVDYNNPGKKLLHKTNDLRSGLEIQMEYQYKKFPLAFNYSEEELETIPVQAFIDFFKKEYKTENFRIIGTPFIGLFNTQAPSPNIKNLKDLFCILLEKVQKGSRINLVPTK